MTRARTEEADCENAMERAPPRARIGRAPMFRRGTRFRMSSRRCTERSGLDKSPMILFKVFREVEHESGIANILIRTTASRGRSSDRSDDFNLYLLPREMLFTDLLEIMRSLHRPRDIRRFAKNEAPTRRQKCALWPARKTALFPASLFSSIHTLFRVRAPRIESGDTPYLLYRQMRHEVARSGVLV